MFFFTVLEKKKEMLVGLDLSQASLSALTYGQCCWCLLYARTFMLRFDVKNNQAVYDEQLHSAGKVCTYFSQT